MTTTHKHPANTAILIGGRALEIEAGAIWDVTESATETQVSLSDCDERDLIGLAICLDWSQGGARPESLAERVEAIVCDPDLLRDHVAHHLAR
jgi:hypothetical protein